MARWCDRGPRINITNLHWWLNPCTLLHTFISLLLARSQAKHTFIFALAIAIIILLYEFIELLLYQTPNVEIRNATLHLSFPGSSAIKAP